MIVMVGSSGAPDIVTTGTDTRKELGETSILMAYETPRKTMTATLNPPHHVTWVPRCAPTPMFASLPVQGRVWPALPSYICMDEWNSDGAGRR